jgi:hypothetical protein
LSIGVVKVIPELFASHHEVAAAMTVAKKEAKRLTGNSYFMSVGHGNRNSEASINI